ncbi:MAG: hypothetical protein ABGZ17_07750, partial [Planctomycetaceae bacterium]
RFRSREEGVAWLKSALLIDPTHSRARRALANYYTATGDKERANRYRTNTATQTESTGPVRTDPIRITPQ